MSQGAPLVEREVDAQWDSHFSEPVAEELAAPDSLSAVRNDVAGQAAQCLQVELEVVSSLPPRLKNKIKLYNLALY